MKSNLRDAMRYDSEQTKALSDVSQLEKKIFEAQKRLAQSEQRFADALKRDQRRADAAQELFWSNTALAKYAGCETWDQHRAGG
ncbi:hypothetical protein EGJ55_14985 [Pseudomonas moraviensis]|nr:hypothetical protein EGJ55_14985 [Pseudomonas moraviensis]